MKHRDLQGADLHSPSSELVENNSGSPIAAFTCVEFNGRGTNYPNIVPGTSASPERLRGITQAAIASGAQGYITAYGMMTGVNTSAWTVGTQLYSDSSGQLTTVIAGSPIAEVLLQSATVGILYVSRLGSAGTTGAPGATGPAGASGATWYSGAGVPSAGTGVNGDFYLNTSNGDVYHKVSGAWGSPIMNLTGATGATGATGPAGTSNGPISVTTKSAAYSLTDNDDFIYLTGSNFAITLHDATIAKKKRYTFVVNSNPVALSGPITFVTSTGQTVGGIASGQYGLYTQDERITLVPDGANWQIDSHSTASKELSDLTFGSSGSGFGTTTNNVATYHREGCYIVVQGEFTPGTLTASAASITLPTFARIDTTAWPAKGVLIWEGFSNNLHSTGFIDTNGNALNFPFYDGANSDGTQIFFCANTSNVQPGNYAKLAGTSTEWISAQPVAFRFKYPVAGWRP